MEKEGYLFEMQRLLMEMESLADKYDVRDNVMSLIVTGVLEETPFGENKLKALYSYNLNSRDELEEIIDFVHNTYEEPKDTDDDQDLETFLRDFGISLN